MIEDLTLEEMQLILDLLGETTRVGGEEECEVHQTKVCLLCGAVAERTFMAKEVTQVSKQGQVKHTTLVSDNGDKPAYTHFEYTTHSAYCHVCTPRLKRLTKGQLVMLVVKLSKLTMYEAQRRGIVDYSPVEEVIKR
jgi:hypothetical protein